LASFGATIEETIGVERALHDRLDAAGVVDLQRRAGRPEAGAERVDVGGGVGASPTIASRAPWPWKPAACSGAMP
jgi:hypothetical protein